MHLLTAILIFCLANLAALTIIPDIHRRNVISAPHVQVHSKRSFAIGNNCFLKDGKPFRYISGSFHYWRQVYVYWEDTFLKMRAAGLNTVQTYINWNLHEPLPGQFYFDGNLHIRKFIKTAQKCGLLVILRPGPFIDAEVDMGGLPYWLLRKKPTMKLRSSDQDYLFYVERWYRKLFPSLRQYLYADGGPIISVQVENEYGWTGKDADPIYIEFLRDLIRELLGPDVVLFTTDGSFLSAVNAGRVDETLTTVDFGPQSNVTSCLFDIERKFNKNGPLVNSEFYPGWMDHWGEPFATTDYPIITQAIDIMMKFNVSFNTYMFYGGSNLGFVAGASLEDKFKPLIQSYDYDAPISEAGDPTLKYMKIRETLQKYFPTPFPPVPPARRKKAYGRYPTSYEGSLYDNLADLSFEPVRSDLPLSFEKLNMDYGFVLYRAEIVKSSHGPSSLVVDGLHDRAFIFLDQKPAGILSRASRRSGMPITVVKGQTLDLLVQNEGRICSGPGINDMKGILGNVSIGNVVLTGWTQYPFGLPGYPYFANLNRDPDHVHRAFNFTTRRNLTSMSQTQTPGFYLTGFFSDVARDTYVLLDGWTHGYLFVNGINMGRYWPAQGPQMTIYVPGVFLWEHDMNIIELFELERAPCWENESCSITFVDKPILNGTVPSLTW